MTGVLPTLPVSGAVAVLAAAGAPLTPRRLRYLWRLPVAGRAARQYSEIDLAVCAVFAELAALCRTLELPVWMARAALRYRERDVRRALERRQPRWLAVDPFRGTAELSESADVRAYAIDLRSVRARVSAAFADHLAARDSEGASAGGRRAAWIAV